MSSYSVFLRMEVLETLRDLNPELREKVFRFARSLEDDPFQDSDSRETDRQGRFREVKRLGMLEVVYYVDNADGEIRILDVRSADG